MPVIRAKGYTLIWKPGTNKETDEYSLFFEDKAVLSPEGNSTSLFLNNEIIQSRHLSIILIKFNVILFR